MRVSIARNISLVLNSRRIPENAGRILWPTLNTIVARKPTVSAWRDAPQMPWERSSCLRLQLFCVETFLLLPKCQSNGRDLSC